MKSSSPRLRKGEVIDSLFFVVALSLLLAVFLMSLFNFFFAQLRQAEDMRRFHRAFVGVVYVTNLLAAEKDGSAAYGILVMPEKARERLEKVKYPCRVRVIYSATEIEDLLNNCEEKGVKAAISMPVSVCQQDSCPRVRGGRPALLEVGICGP